MVVINIIPYIGHHVDSGDGVVVTKHHDHHLIHYHHHHHLSSSSITIIITISIIIIIIYHHTITSYNKILVVISHSQDFLNGVCTDMMVS